MLKTRHVLSVIAVTSLVFVGAGCQKKAAADNPFGPSNTPSTWTGTLARPSGLGSMTVNWPATTDADGNLTGPITFTYNGVSVTIPNAKGGVSGNSSAHYIHVEFAAESGQISSQPGCKMNGASLTQGAGDPFTSPYSNINVTLQTFYTNCQSFIGALNVQENAQLTITK